ncbi:MAG: bifunctional diaminohydroxyphosphoribosylaminopyrimidine deaminase/5-amino-6-(5-phosphoribosylamino)uracil reductase RibD [Prevotella sp.]|nr:bifunctional diaminohydroxyphosphoribosylaminopyrimidine deaminase/5-amino-6-(5-phosphoribosylamino)uracil reductase RibD [Prevotella sp.]
MDKNQIALDEKFMRRCIQLAKCGRNSSRPNPMVGCVIVADGRIIGEGYHVRCGKGHAEVNAFASVKPDDEHLLAQATLYVSLEPCSHHGKTPPCSDLIVRKGVRRVVVGCIDPFSEVQGRGIQRIRDAGIDVTVGVLEAECRWLNRRFFTFYEKNRPYIILKWAQTADGFIDNGGKALAISTSFTKMLVHKLRAEEDAILVGRVTDEREHPQLNVREWCGRSPVRFVVSRSEERGVRNEEGGTRNEERGTRNEERETRSEERGVRSEEGEARSEERGKIWVNSFEGLFRECREQQLQSLIVEGGRETLQSFLDRDLWDEIRVEKPQILSPKGEGETFYKNNTSTLAPLLPQHLKPDAEEIYDGHAIVYYFNRQ